MIDNYNKYQKERMKKLYREGKDDLIFHEFGIKTNKYNFIQFLNFVQNDDPNSLVDRFGTIVDNEFHSISAMFSDEKLLTGATRAISWATKRVLMNIIGFSLLASPFAIPYVSYLMIDENKVAYASQIEDYNKYNEEYAAQFEGKDLTELEIIMKVMDDMWSRMKGYGEPEINAYGFYELDTGRDDGVGVCRNIASDFAKKMNEINPNFNARTIYVTMDPMYSYSVDENYTEPIHEGLVDGMDIVYVVDTEHEDVSENTEVTEDGISSNVHVNITGNHEIVFLTIDDMIIAVDPTNLMIGQYVDGEIVFFNDTSSGNPVKFDGKEAFTAYMQMFTEKTGVFQDYMKSYNNTKYSFDELKEMMGTKAQEKALESARRIFNDNTNTYEVSDKNEPASILPSDIFKAILKSRNENNEKNNEENSPINPDNLDNSGNLDIDEER